MENRLDKKWFLELLPYWIVCLLAELAEISAWVGPYPSMKKILIACLIPHVLILICGAIRPVHRWMVAIEQFLWKQLKTLKNHQWKKGLLMVGADVVLACVSERILTWIANGSLTAPYHFRKAVFSFTVWFILSLLIVFRDELRTKIELVVFLVILSTGTAYVTTVPVSCGISWDDEMHFHFSLYLEHILHGRMTYADADILNKYYTTALEHDIYTEETHAQWLAQLNADAASGAYGPDGRMWPVIEYWCYIPGAIGLTIGNALHLPYALVFMLGKWCNLLLYAVLIYFSMKRIKTGKMLVASVAMLPPCILMAASYSRDPYMIGFIMLGFCYFIGELQEPNKQLKLWDMAIILGAFVIGVMPKAIYVPLILIVLFMPKEKFASVRQCRIYRICVVLATLLVLATFAVPFVSSGGGAVEDTRGGSEVSASGQTAFILGHPLQYTMVLLNFLRSYLSLSKAVTDLGSMHYFGTASFVPLLIVLLFVVAFTDREERYDRSVKASVRVAGLILSLGAVCLAATAMYIAFTAVGSEEIMGCQYRYLLQVMFPMLYLVFWIPMNNRMKKEWYRGIILAILSVVELHALWTQCIAGF
ncbi:MAG: DUF2142 domain-containing protein [Lachnospiraceae bacterium]|nr:DUF2142 domain-containing protein [Lachnospiraceae bacterium]